jgi:hypothetical protein
MLLVIGNNIWHLMVILPYVFVIQVAWIFIFSKDKILLYIDICSVGFVLEKYQILLTFMF